MRKRHIYYLLTCEIINLICLCDLLVEVSHEISPNKNQTHQRAHSSFMQLARTIPTSLTVPASRRVKWCRSTDRWLAFLAVLPTATVQL